MKHLVTMLMLSVATLGFSQSNNPEENKSQSKATVSDLKISITVDSKEELENSIKMEDIEEFMDMSDNDEQISFEIICNGEKISKDVNRSLTYKVKGNTSDRVGFLKSVEKVRTAAINFYNSKK
ncbi:hypothetical protein [Sediminibacter sp. Hel_I_10]|uniref:hypothetical protein n=1 Tax=Sediminibacter sp. Hel_I_10 TaxID=1392490 RepID=UPI00055DEC5E|nr:hypothetical protein [Sediminibacter sp. Hel_I_10]